MTPIKYYFEYMSHLFEVAKKHTLFTRRTPVSDAYLEKVRLEVQKMIGGPLK